MEIPSRDPEESYASEVRSSRGSTGSVGGWTPPTVEEIVQLFPHCEVLQLIAYGGMGAVYRARQITLDREVAIKLLPIEVSGDQSYADRFVREGRAMAKLNHPNIVAVHDFGTTSEGHLFLIMEYIDGATLHDFIHGGNLSLDQSLYIIEQVCEALAYAHGLGIVHRDIKPANVMVDRSLRAKVADFGLARINENNAAEFGITVTGQVMGTPNYIAPEQLQAMNVDHRADIYSLGVMLYESIAHEVPRGIFLPLSKRVGADPRIDTIVTRAMQQHPDLRFQSTREMKALVTSVRTTRRPVATHPPTPKKSNTPLWIGGAVAVVVIAALFFLMQDEGKPVVEPTPEPVREVAKPPPPPAVEVVKSTPAVQPPPVAPITEPKPEPMPEPKPEPTPTPKPPSEISKWLAQVDEQYGGPFRREVLEPYESGVAKLREQYTAAVARSITTASTAGKLDDALALRTEQARLTANRLPHQDEDEATDPPVLRQLRENWRKAFSKLDTDRFTKAKAAHARYDAALAQNQTQLTQRQQLDDAVLVKQKRDEIAAAWLTPAFNLTKPAAPAPTPAVATKPLGNVMPAAKPTEGLLTGRDAILHLHAHGYGISFVDAKEVHGSVTAESKPEDVPKGRLEITGLITPGERRTDASPRGFDDNDFAQLAPLRRLINIESKTRNATGTGYAYLADAPDLHTVVIVSPLLTSAVLPPLLGLRKISSLSLTGFTEPTSWSRFGELSALPTLTFLQITYAGTIPPAVLSRARKLRTLMLHATQLTVEHFAAIGTLPELESLTLEGQKEAGAAGLKHLELCPKLTELNLVGSSGVVQHLGFLGKMRKLTTLFVDGNEAPSLTVAAGAPALRTLHLSANAGTSGTTDAGLKAIATSFPRLESLIFTDFAPRSVTAAGLASLAPLPKLKAIQWGKMPLPVDFATALATLPALDSLSLCAAGLDEKHFTALASSKSITTLDITHQKFTPAALEILKTIRTLRSINVYNCGLTPEQLTDLRNALPKCSIGDG